MHGPWVKYWKNGQLQEKGTYKKGKEDGPFVKYHENGQLQSKGTYKDGKKDGPWVSYNRDGTVLEEYTGTFKDGMKVK
jgi:antitoxin component YwqK of YwqJK toxin-antitoxin module